MEKMFKNDEKQGWNWHKSWNIPPINMILTVKRKYNKI